MFFQAYLVDKSTHNKILEHEFRILLFCFGNYVGPNNYTYLLFVTIYFLIVIICGFSDDFIS